MKKLLLTMTALSACAIAAPAAAQSSGYQYPNSGYQNNGYQNGYQNNGYQNGYQNNGYYNQNANGGVGMENRLARIDGRIQAGIQNGSIDQREARTLRRQLNDIRRLDQQYGRDGYSQQERADMQQRLRAFRDQLNYADGGRGGNGQYGSNNGYNNGGYNGQGGPYEEVCDTQTSSGSGVLGGIFDSIFGGGASTSGYANCAGLRVGQRVSGNLGAVPYQYRNQYRDSGNTYYRSDGRQIYQVDSRTNTVVRIFGM
jgi:hypothetical protein